ncbi:MAG TPA: hypothetical protein DCE31_10040, partial [Lautropia sp.]|nr:hypothetical protein [Lautropia sp.]
MLSPKQVKPIPADGADAQGRHPEPEPAETQTASTPAIDLRGYQLQLNELIQHERLRVHLQDGSIFEGKLFDGLPQGDASWTQPDGIRIEGRWQAGELIGEVRVSYPDGCIFQGQVLDGYAQGSGKTKRPNGMVYEGQYQEGRPKGLGRLTWPDGRAFEGRFEDEANGFGRLAWPDGRVFQGRLRDGELADEGELTWP